MALDTENATRSVTDRAAMTQGAELWRTVSAMKAGIALAAVALIIWPYLQYPGTILYNRYFEAWLIFNPSYAYATFASGWSYHLHLGYPNLLEPSYFSIFTAAIWLLHEVGGSAFASRIYPILVSLFAFGSMLAYLREDFHELPWLAKVGVAGLFTINPVTAGMLHEGYSGMLIDLAMIPLSLALIDMCERTGRRNWLAALPLLFTATAMVRLNEVAVVWAVLAVLRWQVWGRLFASGWKTCAIFAAALAVNAYWVFPVILNAATHAHLPIQEDTASEVALMTQYGTLSNVVLLRLFGLFEHDSSLCSACGYYVSGAYTLGALALAGISAWGLWTANRTRDFCVLIGAILLATGYHYQDDLLGAPYQLLMQLPTMQIFRNSNIFTIAVVFEYCVGAACALQIAGRPARRFAKTLTSCVAVAALLVAWPGLSGAILERGATVAGVVQAQNFFVSVPSEYAAARDTLSTLKTDGVTLLLPDQSFAAYRWGAYVQDFLPAFVNRPSFETWYWHQHDPSTEALLETISGSGITRERESALLRELRIDSVLIHDDTTYSMPAALDRFGRVVFRQGAIRVAVPDRPIVPMTVAGGAPIATSSSAAGDAPVVAALFDRTTRVAGADDRLGCVREPIGDAFFRGQSGVSTPMVLPTVASCAAALPITAYVKIAGARVPTIGVFRQGRVIAMTTTVHQNAEGLSRLRAQATLIPGDRVVVVPRERGDQVLAIVAGDVSGVSEQRPYPLHMVLGAVGFASLNDDSSFVVHQSDDPSWMALTIAHGSVTAAPKFEADGYANGWAVTPRTTLIVLNLAQLAFVVGCFVSLLALALVALGLRSVERNEAQARPSPL